MKNFINLKLIFSIIFVLFISVNQRSFLAQWQPDLRLTNNIAESKGAYNNSKWIASSGNKLHIVWMDSRSGIQGIYYKRSTNGGETWSTDIKLNDTSSYAFDPSIALSGYNVHVVWGDERHGQSEIYYVRSTNGGMTWGNNVRLTNNPGNSGKVSISASGSFVNIVWNDTRDGNAEIYYKKSTDNGATWSADMRLTNAPNVSQMPSVSQSGLNVHVVWEDYRNSNAGEIFNKNSTDGGQTWSSDLLIANDLLSSWLPSMSVSGTSIHIAYIVQVTPSHFEIFYKKSSDNGLTWGSGVRLTNTSVNSGLPSIFSYGSAIHLVYTRGYLPDIYYIRSTNNGNTWETETRLTNDPAESDNPSVSVSNSAVRVVWNDSRDGNREIYYKKNPTGNGIYSISGTITYSDNSQPVSEGFVKALSYDPETSEIITVDSTVINSNGTYSLGHIPNDSVDIMFYQNDDLLDFVPTYYVSTIDWREAETIYVTQNLTNINGQVYRINNQTNPYNISGQTFQNTPGD